MTASYNETLSMNGVWVCMLHTNTDICRSIKLTFALMLKKKTRYSTRFFIFKLHLCTYIKLNSMEIQLLWCRMEFIHHGVHLNIRIIINWMKIRFELISKKSSNSKSILFGSVNRELMKLIEILRWWLKAVQKWAREVNRPIKLRE